MTNHFITEENQILLICDWIFLQVQRQLFGASVIRDTINGHPNRAKVLFSGFVCLNCVYPIVRNYCIELKCVLKDFGRSFDWTKMFLVSTYFIRYLFMNDGQNKKIEWYQPTTAASASALPTQFPKCVIHHVCRGRCRQSHHTLLQMTTTFHFNIHNKQPPFDT